MDGSPNFDPGTISGADLDLVTLDRLAEGQRLAFFVFDALAGSAEKTNRYQVPLKFDELNMNDLLGGGRLFALALPDFRGKIWSWEFDHRQLGIGFHDDQKAVYKLL